MKGGNPMEEYKIPVSAVAEVMYCPRNFYYRVIEQVEDYNSHMLVGRLQENDRNIRELLNIKGREKIRGVSLQSDEMGLVGTIDELEIENEYMYPVEYKKGEEDQSESSKIQLCCYALILEEVYKTKIEKGYLYFRESKSKIEVSFTEELREVTYDTIETAKKILKDGLAPEPLCDARCVGCSMINYCMPDEIYSLTRDKEKPIKLVASVNLGRTLYIDNSNIYLKKRDGRILVQKENETIHDIPMNAVDQIIIIGNAQISTQLINELLERRIPVYFSTSYGKCLGWLNPVYNKNCIMRIKQFKGFDSPEFCLRIAKEIVRGKLINSRVLLMRYYRSIKNDNIKRHAGKIREYISNISKANSIEELMGIEGIGSREYFICFKLLINDESLCFDFEKRTRRPPKDPVNAMLSYTYTLLTNEVKNEIIRVGLDPYIGFFHSNVYGRPALALDIMEEFRQIIADSVVLTAINKKMINSNDFDWKMGACLLNEIGRKKLFSMYRKRINEEIKHPLFRYTVSYRRIIELQCRLLSKVLTGELDEYKAFVVR